MRTALILTLSLLVAGCESLPAGFPGSGETRTFQQPIARVKPAFVSTLAQLGLPIAAMETRSGNEVVKAGRADKNVAIEFERLSAAATRVRVSGSGDLPAQVMRETEKRLGAGATSSNRAPAPL